MTAARRSAMARLLALIVGASLVGSIHSGGPALLAQTATDHWVGTWATALVSRDPQPAVPVGQPAGPAPLNFNNQTIRQVVHVSIGGSRVRIVLSNAFGTSPLAVGAAHVAIRDKAAAIVSASDRALTFSGNASVSIPAGASLVSDPVSLSVAPLSDLVVDIHLPGDTESGSSPLTMHSGAQQTNYVSSPGNHAGEQELTVQTTTRSWYFLARIEVAAATDVGAVAAIGDSITDGSQSSVDANSRWPDQLARRLAAASIRMGVLNLGIGGNRLLLDGVGPNALARFDRDVLMQSGLTHVIVLEGINDIRHTAPPVLAADLIAAHRQLIDRAHTRGLKVYGALLTPFEGSLYSEENEAKRQALIAWIRTSGGYDGIIDFDAAVRDAGRPIRLAPQFDSGDHIHPNDAGYRAMGDAINVQLFKAAARSTAATK